VLPVIAIFVAVYFWNYRKELPQQLSAENGSKAM